MLARYHDFMAVRVLSNNLPLPAVGGAVEAAVQEAIGAPTGDWMVQIHENQDSPSWHITIWGPNKFHWTREFFGIDEQNPLNGYAFIRKAISDVMRPVVYLSYAFPDNKDGFVLHLANNLAQELQVQIGRPIDVIWDMDRTRPGATWSKDAEKRVEKATFLVPVVSPSYFNNEECRKEFVPFIEREYRGNSELVLPLYFVSTGEIDGTSAQSEVLWVQALRRHKIVDFREHRFDFTTTKARRAIASLAALIRGSYARLLQEATLPVDARPKPTTEVVDPLYIQSLDLRDFRCFEHIELRFDRPSSLEGRWTCIAGINGAGKSTILQALSVALLGNPLALELGGERLNRMRRQADMYNRMRAVIKVELMQPESNDSLRLHLAIDEGRIVTTAGPSFDPSPSSSWDRVGKLVVAGYGASRNLSPRVDSGSEHLSVEVRHQITLFDPLSQIAGAEALLGQQSAAWLFPVLFQNVIQQVFETDLQAVLGSPLSGVFFTLPNMTEVEAIDLPDGFRSAAAWLADLCSLWCEKAPTLAQSLNPADIHAIVLIDEIDLHLHPSLQRALIPRLRKTFPKVQWIVTTHSPLVLANFDLNEIIALDRDQEGNIRQLDRQILGFTADEIYEWLMGTRPTGVAVEEELRKSDEGVGKSQEELARQMRVSPGTDEEAAQKQVAEFREILKTLKR